MHCPRRHRSIWGSWFRSGAKVVAWAFALWVIVVGLQACADGRLLFRPKPPLEQLPQGPPKFVPSR